MDFRQVVEEFLSANPRLSRDERNLKMIVDYILANKITLTTESAPTLLAAFVREHSHELLWLAEPEKVQRRYSDAAYNPVEELAKSHEKARQKRAAFRADVEHASKRQNFIVEMNRVKAWKEFTQGKINWAKSFVAQTAKYEALKATFPEFSAEIEAAAERVGK